AVPCRHYFLARATGATAGARTRVGVPYVCALPFVGNEAECVRGVDNRKQTGHWSTPPWNGFQDILLPDRLSSATIKTEYGQILRVLSGRRSAFQCRDNGFESAWRVFPGEKQGLS